MDLRRMAVVGTALVVMILPTGTAAATGTSPLPEVTLRAAEGTIDFGRRVELRGRISLQQPDQVVQIVDESGSVVETASTNGRGRFRLRLAPAANSSFRAQWATAVSDAARVRVRPVVVAKLRGVRVFRDAVVRGRLAPAHPDARIAVRLFRNGKPYAKRSVPLRDGRRFRTRFEIRKAGMYRAKARFGDDDHAPGIDRSKPKLARLPNLDVGDRSPYVTLLEKRLRRLNYYIRGVDRVYDERTADAVRAFNKVQGRERLGSVDASTWRALVSPSRPRPRQRTKGFHIEVDQTKQLLYTVRDGAVKNILHVSTGAGGATQDGSYHVYRKLAGYSGGGLYYPSYFDGLRALHGWEEVPTYPASHGCVRLPMWSAQWVHSITPIGTEVLIYH